MGLTVDTSYLRGYALQLDGNRLGALADMRSYCAAYCGQTDGLGGPLASARWAVESMSETFDRWFAGGERGLARTGDDLRLTADRYDNSDAAAADRLWATAQVGELPSGYAERDVAVMRRGFSAGATVSLAIPQIHNDAQSAKDSLDMLLRGINHIVQWITGQDVLGAAMPIVFGEWGVLRSIAEAYDEVERGCDRVRQDLADGLDLLSAHWTSDGQGGASTAFDYHLREHWVRGFEVIANVANGAQQTFEWMANAYEYLVNVFLIALDRYTRGIRTAIDALTMPNPMKGALRLAELVIDTLGLIDDTIRMICLQTEIFQSSIEMMVANLQGMSDVLGGGVDAFERA